MSTPILVSSDDLHQLCQRLRQSESIAFDTEFVSEHTYRQQLCLVQVATPSECVAIDPLAVGDMRPFWDVLVAPGHQTIVHAGREELIFCHEATGAAPAALFDVQLGAGMIGHEYPAGYGNLVLRLLGGTPSKGETRTDWRKRPLTDRQIQYALEDVRHLHALRDKLKSRFEELDRGPWFEQEMRSWQQEVIMARQRERWRRVAGSASLSPRSQAIVRELWKWRDAEAARRDRPMRTILRDDLIVELAKRRSADPKQIRALRGMERGDLQRAVPQLSQAIETALALPDHECPESVHRGSSAQLTMLGQFLSSALSSICRDANVSVGLVGTATDVRDLVAYHLGEREGLDPYPPALTQGWRAEVVGHVLEDLLWGRTSIRICDPTSEQPLRFERHKQEGAAS